MSTLKPIGGYKKGGYKKVSPGNDTGSPGGPIETSDPEYNKWVKAHLKYSKIKDVNKLKELWAIRPDDYNNYRIEDGKWVKAPLLHRMYDDHYPTDKNKSAQAVSNQQTAAIRRQMAGQSGANKALPEAQIANKANASSGSVSNAMKAVSQQMQSNASSNKRTTPLSLNEQARVRSKSTNQTTGATTYTLGDTKSVTGKTQETIYPAGGDKSMLNANNPALAGLPDSVKSMLSRVNAKDLPYAQAALAAYQDSVNSADAENSLQGRATAVMSEGQQRLQGNIDSIQQAAVAAEMNAKKRTGDILDLATAHHEGVLQRGDESVKALDSGVAAAHENITDSFSKVTGESDAAWEAAEQGIVRSIEEAKAAVSSSLADKSKEVKDYMGEASEKADKVYGDAESKLKATIEEIKNNLGDTWSDVNNRVERKMEIAAEQMKNLTADTIQASIDGLTASYNDAIRKAKANYNISGDPSSAAEVKRLEGLRRKAIATEASKARVYYNDAINNLNSSNIQVTASLGAQEATSKMNLATNELNASTNLIMKRAEVASNFGLRESEILSSLLQNGLMLEAGLETTGMQLTADVKEKRAAMASQMGITEAQLQSELDKQGLTLKAGLMQNEDMYAGYSGQLLVNTASSLEQMNRAVESQTLNTNIAMTQLSNAGYSDMANFIRNTPLAQADLSPLLLSLVTLIEDGDDSNRGFGPVSTSYNA